MAVLTWLHLSDWHQGASDFDRDIVRDALLDDINQRINIDPVLEQIDFIFFTGDLAFSGKKAEYEAARDLLLEPTRTALGLEKDQLFLIPGNHDLNRDMFDLLPSELLKPFKDEAQVKKWLTDNLRRDHLLEPFNAYEKFVKEYNPAGFGAYGDWRKVSVKGKEVGIIGMNSALMCGRNTTPDGKIDDKNRLTVGEPQIHEALRAIAKTDIRIALIHHPFDWLNDDDSVIIDTRLQQGCDFILRGHVHRQGVQVSKGIQGNCVIIPGGACFDGRVPYRMQYINAYNYVSYDTDTGQGTVYLRRWSLDNTRWTEDTDHVKVKDGKYLFAVNPQ